MQLRHIGIIRSLLAGLLAACAVFNLAYAQSTDSDTAPRQAETLTAQPAPVLAPSSLFAGPYVGFKLGGNWSDAHGAQHESLHFTMFPGLVAGYGVDVGPVVIGAELFADFHNGSTTRKDGGIDMKLGLPINKLMPFVRVGATASWPDTRPHGGLGLEYKFARHLSLSGEWTIDSSKTDGTRRTNNSVTLGLNYRFF